MFTVARLFSFNAYPRWRKAAAVVLAIVALHASTQAWAQAPTVDLQVRASSPHPEQVDLVAGAVKQLDTAVMARWLKKNAQLWQFLEEPALSEAELADLMARAPQNIGELLQTQGYFNSQVTVTTDATPPLIEVDLGPVTTVVSVDIQVVDGNGVVASGLTAEANAAWPLQAGAIFTQSAWQSAKDKALVALSSNVYYQASVSESQARIDPERQIASLSLLINTGPAFSFGSSNVLGAQRYQAAHVLNMARLGGIRQGQPYTASALFEAQRRIMDNGNYSGAFITLTPSANNQLSAQLNANIDVNEKPLKHLETSIGVSTDSGPRLHITHTHYRVPIIDWQAVHTIEWQRDAQTLSSNWLSPQDLHAWRWTGGIELTRQVDDDITTSTQNWRAGQTQTLDRVQRTYYLQLSQSKEQVKAKASQRTATLSAHWAWSRTRWDSDNDPQDGHALSFDLAAGTTLRQGTKPYMRAQTQWLGLRPFDNPKMGRMAARIALGTVIADQDTAVPASELFLTGGDTSVRGYAARSIGRTDRSANATGLILPGRLLWLGGLEWQRPTTWGGDVGRLEQTFFVDAAAVSNRLNEQQVYVGTGTGVRFISPVGPMQLDIAYGHQTKEWRLHLFVGIRF